MNIYYQGNVGSYMGLASEEISKHLNIKIDSIIGLEDFNDVWETISNDSIAVLAIENSYMGSIHPNLYGFLKYDYKIIGEYMLEIKHCLCSKEKHLDDIIKSYSQKPALEQCHKYLKSKNIKSIAYSDTALAAKYIKQSSEKGLSAICSEKAANLHGLNILDKNIADQKGNTTVFVIIVTKDSNIKYNKKSTKTSLIFEAKNIPASLYKCLGVFAKNNINLTKIESLPSFKGKFSYFFWISFEGILQEQSIIIALEELKQYTNRIRILGEH